MVIKYDIDGSGEIEFDEFALMMGESLFEYRVDPEISEAFLVFSKGRDNAQLTSREIVFMMKQFKFEITDEDAKEIIASVDF